MLCQNCLNTDIDALTVNLPGTFNDLKDQSLGYKDHIYLCDLFASAQQHCELCQQIGNDFKFSSECSLHLVKRAFLMQKYIAELLISV